MGRIGVHVLKDFGGCRSDSRVGRIRRQVRARVARCDCGVKPGYRLEETL
jgi:hypothetical protein